MPEPLPNRMRTRMDPDQHIKPDPAKGRPLIYTTYQRQDIGAVVYLVNNTGHVLEWVDGGAGGCITAGEEAVTRDDGDDKYLNVEPNEAVRIGEVDGMLDFDWIIQFSATIKSPQLGLKTLLGGARKGGITCEVLLWESDV